MSQHPQFAQLLQWLNQERFEVTRVRVSSVRAASVTPELGRILAKRGSKSLRSGMMLAQYRRRGMPDPHQLELANTLLSIGLFLVIFLAARTLAELMVRLQLPTILGELLGGGC